MKKQEKKKKERQKIENEKSNRWKNVRFCDGLWHQHFWNLNTQKAITNNGVGIDVVFDDGDGGDDDGGRNSVPVTAIAHLWNSLLTLNFCSCIQSFFFFSLRLSSCYCYWPEKKICAHINILVYIILLIKLESHNKYINKNILLNSNFFLFSYKSK